MPKKNSKRGSKKTTQSNQLLLRNEKENQEYAEVLKPLGNCMFLVKFLNGEEVVAKLKGSMTRGRKFDKVAPKHTVLVQKDGCTTGKDVYYIFHKYGDNEKKQLERLGELVQVSQTEQDDIFGYEGDEQVQALNEAEIDDAFIDDI